MLLRSSEVWARGAWFVVLIGALATVGVSPAAALSGGRAYELVSPPAKNGADVMPSVTRTRAAHDGDAITFASLGGFGDVAGTGIATEYLSRRTGVLGTNGWSTHGIVPKVDPMSLGAGVADIDTAYQGEFSDDLQHGVLRTFTNLTGDPDVGQVENLYVRNDLLSPGAGSFALITPCPVCVAPLDLLPIAPGAIADATADFGKIALESWYNLTPGAIDFGPKVYEWDHGTLRLAGILPADEGGGAAPISIAGAGATSRIYTPHVVSDDGSKIFFTVPPGPFDRAGRVYMREDQTATVWLSKSERTDCADDPVGCTGTPALDPGGERPAQYETANVDGSKVFFTSPEQLTDTAGSGVYMYDTSKPDSDVHNLTLVSVDEDTGGGASEVRVVGASDDGSYVYFAANDQLVAGGPSTGGLPGLFVWHAGEVAFIGTLTVNDDASNNAIAHVFTLAVLSARVSPSGHALLFTARSGDGLSPQYDHNTVGCGFRNGTSCSELYLYQAETDTLSCVSCNPTGAPATADAGFTLGVGAGGSRETAHLSRPLSDDGRHVFFTTGERLVPQDQNGAKRDVYEYDSKTAALSLISSGRSGDDSYFLDASADGADAFFVTRERLVGWDRDDSYDLYDARAGGGFPEPAASAPECLESACQGQATQLPPLIVPSTEDFVTGNDNVKRGVKRKALHCKKGKVRKRVHGKVRCVKKAKQKHQRAGRAK